MPEIPSFPKDEENATPDGDHLPAAQATAGGEEAATESRTGRLEVFFEGRGGNVQIQNDDAEPQHFRNLRQTATPAAQQGGLDEGAVHAPVRATRLT